MCQRGELHHLRWLNKLDADNAARDSSEDLEEARAADAADAAVILEFNKSLRAQHYVSGLSDLLQKCDSSGSVEHMATSHPIRQLALQQFQEAMNILSVELKIDYLTALAIAPAVVMKESDPMRFLRCANYDPSAAAEYVAAYWRCRREVFLDRAFLPLTLTGHGALDEESVAHTKTGVRMFLPKDSKGRSVLYVDSSRHLHESPQTRARSVFYCLHVLTEHEPTAKEGVVVIFDESLVAIRDKFSACLTRIVGQFAPLRVHAVHVCCCRPKWKRLPSVNLIEQGKLKLIGIRALSLMNMVHYHDTEDRTEMVNLLKQYGLREDGIPFALGGTWSVEEHMTWFLERLRLDSGLPPYASNHGDGQCIETTLLADCNMWTTLAMNNIPAADKSEYNDAVRSVPELVQKESSINDFLRAENYHVANACRRLVGYWRVRSRLFGRRALNVVSQTGEGVLCRQDRDMLARMFTVLLPADGQGRPVVWIDTTPWVSSGQAESADRVLFYILSIAAENPVSQKAGAIILLLFKGGAMLRLERFREIVLALPLCVRSVHLLCLDQCPLDAPDQLNFGFKPYVHVQSRMADFRPVLEGYGLQGTGLPSCLGGTWGLGKFVYWQELRIRREWGLVIRSPNDMLDYPGLCPRVILEAADAKEKARRMEVVHARRKSDRIRVETALLEDQIGQLRAEQEGLVGERHRLEKLLLDASSMLSNVNQGDD